MIDPRAAAPGWMIRDNPANWSIHDPAGRLRMLLYPPTGATLEESEELVRLIAAALRAAAPAGDEVEP